MGEVGDKGKSVIFMKLNFLTSFKLKGYYNSFTQQLVHIEKPLLVSVET